MSEADRSRFTETYTGILHNIQSIAYRHIGKNNTVFLDLHISSFSIGEFETEMNPGGDPDYLYWRNQY
jgi:hypothetical protein